ncbi:MAG: flavin reductase [Gammaproteobacteria bacterium WSBS_2016_MAG_OTU1]
MTHLDSRKLRAAFGTFMTGVTVVATADKRGSPIGFTANSYTSVSLSPPLLLVCPAQGLSSFDVWQECEHFTVSVLAESQQDIANIFAAGKGDRFSQVEWHKNSACCPIINGAAASFSCSVHNRIMAGDHIILVGEINEFSHDGGGGLGYVNGGYFSLGLEHRAAEMPTQNGRQIAGAIVEYNGKVLLTKTTDGMRPPQTQANGGGSLAALRQMFENAGMEVEIGSVYSIFENTTSGDYFIYYRVVAKTSDACGLGEYYSPDDIAGLSFCGSGLETMMKRYALECKNGIFGLYVGDDTSGNVHVAEEEKR